MAKQNYGGVYANMEFPPYEFREYPKHVVTGPFGQYEVANNETEETVIRAKLQKDHDDAPAVAAPMVADPAKEILISRAREIGVPFNPMWSKVKLDAVVKAAEAELDNLPPEEDDKDALIARANALGIKATKLWGIPRLKQDIAAAEADQA